MRFGLGNVQEWYELAEEGHPIPLSSRARRAGVGRAAAGPPNRPELKTGRMAYGLAQTHVGDRLPTGMDPLDARLSIAHQPFRLIPVL